MRRSLICAAIVLSAAMPAAPLCAAPAPGPNPAAPTTQLPRTVRPSHYEVTLEPDAPAGRFEAKATITLEVLEPCISITLNATDLVFRSAQLKPVGALGAAQVATIAVNPAEQSATFSFTQVLAKGRYQLALDYSGIIGSQAVGLFALDYDSANGRKRALYTQFENSDARRMIPSWDEPAYKATFKLEAVVPAGQLAVSNMPIESSSALPDGRSLVKFAQTPKMSTYLLFFGSGEFERASRMVDGTEIGVITKKGGSAQAAFVLAESGPILREYNDYFGVRYPLPKLDNVAAPGRSQFFGAMENWGGIFTFEYDMLLDPAISTQADKQNVFATAAHEMAHQWFGDLVTMQWWDDLWLNEGFASWMESRMMERLHPEWNTALHAVDARQLAMERDALATTHPVVQHVSTVDQASQAFDTITYQKGESVIRMLETYVGADAWRNGVRAYMQAHAYGSTVSDDLWRQIEKAAGKPVTAIAHDFTLQPGIPMIRASEPLCKDGKTSVSLVQGEFSADQPNKKPLRWRVPVIAQVAGSASSARVLVGGGAATLTLEGCGALVLNAGQSGYYRTMYAPHHFAALTRQFGTLAPIDQLGLLSDSWSLGLAGYQPMSDFLELAQATPLSADPQVWGNIAAAFGTINKHYRDDPKRRTDFAAFAIARLAPLMAQLGWNERAGEPDPVATLRADLIGTLAGLGDAPTIAEARRRYASADASAMPAALRKTIMGVVAQHADAATWDAMRRAARAETSPMIKDQLYELLAQSEQPALAERALSLALTGEAGATIGAGMISTVASHSPDLAFTFALANLEKVNELVDSTSRSRYYPRLAEFSADPATIGKLTAYANAQLAQGSRRDADAAIANITSRIKVRAERLPAIDIWLARQGQAGAAASGSSVR
ncbi:MAG: M1 family metallopeptidase [Pseudomonadota bacterium]